MGSYFVSEEKEGEEGEAVNEDENNYGYEDENNYDNEERWEGEHDGDEEEGGEEGDDDDEADVSDVSRLLAECWVDPSVEDKIIEVCQGDSSAHIVRAGVQCLVSSGAMSLVSARQLWDMALNEAKDVTCEAQDDDLVLEEEEVQVEEEDKGMQSAEEYLTEAQAALAELSVEIGEEENEESELEKEVRLAREELAKSARALREEEREIRARIMERYRLFLVSKGRLSSTDLLSSVEGETKESMFEPKINSKERLGKDLNKSNKQEGKEYEIVLSDSDDDVSLLRGDETSAVAPSLSPSLQMIKDNNESLHGELNNDMNKTEGLNKKVNTMYTNETEAMMFQDDEDELADLKTQVQDEAMNYAMPPVTSQVMEGIHALVIDGCEDHIVTGLYTRAFARGVPRYFNAGPLFVQDRNDGSDRKIFLHRNR